MFIILLLIEIIIFTDYLCAAIMACNDKYNIITISTVRSLGDVMIIGAISIGLLSAIFLLLTIIRLLKAIFSF